jgi:hypothetical protein
VKGKLCSFYTSEFGNNKLVEENFCNGIVKILTIFSLWFCHMHFHKHTITQHSALLNKLFSPSSEVLHLQKKTGYFSKRCVVVVLYVCDSGESPNQYT